LAGINDRRRRADTIITGADLLERGARDFRCAVNARTVASIRNTRRARSIGAGPWPIVWITSGRSIKVASNTMSGIYSLCAGRVTGARQTRNTPRQ
jgi:hypothetical protein